MVCRHPVAAKKSEVFDICSGLALLPVNSIHKRYRPRISPRSEEHTSELQSPCNLVCRLLLEKKKPGLAHASVLRGRPEGATLRASVTSARPVSALRRPAQLTVRLGLPRIAEPEIMSRSADT